MNLVIDEAVEVRQITKTNDKESRRSLGKAALLTGPKRTAANNLFYRPDPAQGRQRLADPEPLRLEEAKLKAKGDTKHNRLRASYIHSTAFAPDNRPQR